MTHLPMAWDTCTPCRSGCKPGLDGSRWLRAGAARTIRLPSLGWCRVFVHRDANIGPPGRHRIIHNSYASTDSLNSGVNVWLPFIGLSERRVLNSSPAVDFLNRAEPFISCKQEVDPVSCILEVLSAEF